MVSAGDAGQGPRPPWMTVNQKRPRRSRWCHPGAATRGRLGKEMRGRQDEAWAAADHWGGTTLTLSRVSPSSRRAARRARRTRSSSRVRLQETAARRPQSLLHPCVPSSVSRTTYTTSMRSRTSATRHCTRTSHRYVFNAVIIRAVLRW